MRATSSYPNVFCRTCWKKAGTPHWTGIRRQMRFQPHTSRLFYSNSGHLQLNIGMAVARRLGYSGDAAAAFSSWCARSRSEAVPL